MKQINTLDTKFTTDIASANAAIQSEATARSTADAAQASVSEGLKAELVKSGEASLSNALKDFGGEQRQLKASADIRTEMNVVVDSQKALAERVDVVESSFETEIGKTNAAITDLARATTTADKALAKSIGTVQADLNGTLATVQEHSQAIVDLEGGAQAMWSVKAQAGDISAGIGLIADQATGESQVMVNASQFFVFDNAVGKTAIFAIDQGQVIIRDAVIRKATIDILNTETITATNVKSGQAGFGAGGSYPMFGSNWFTTIDSTGTIRTNKLQAAGGNITNMNIGNCTISGDCDVKGTVYAAKLVGDVTKVRAFDLGLLTGQIIPGGTAITLLSVNFDSVEFVQEMTIEQIDLRVWGYEQGSTTARMYVKIGSGAGVQIDVKSSSGDIFTAIAPRTVNIPAGQSSLTIYYVAERKTSYNRLAQRRLIYLNKQGGSFSAS